MRALYPELQDKDVTVQVGALQHSSDGPPAVFNIWISERTPYRAGQHLAEFFISGSSRCIVGPFDSIREDNRIDPFLQWLFLTGETRGTRQSWSTNIPTGMRLK